MSAGMKFILPLREDTVNVEPEFYENTDDHKFDGVFTYNKRAIWYRKKPAETEETLSIHSGMTTAKRSFRETM